MALLESRALLSGMAGSWIGQDGQDFVGPTTIPGPSGVQDIHIALTGLPADRLVSFADVQGLGGGDWQYHGSYGPWAALALKQPGATTGDLFIEPYQVETGRPFTVSLRYDDGSTDFAWIGGGAADPNLRVSSAAMHVVSSTQNGADFVGAGPSVGPDGLQDLSLHLTGLSPDVGIDGITIAGPSGNAWATGANPTALGNAELYRTNGDPSQADLYLQPSTDLSGQTLTFSLRYSNDKTDSTSYVVPGPVQPALPVAPPAAAPTIVAGVSATWKGQDGLNLTGMGDAHVALSGLPSGRTVVAATLSDPVGDLWAFKTGQAGSYYIDPFTPTLGFAARSGGAADLTFAPQRDEAGATLTLRLQYDDGTIAVVPIAAGSTDLGLRTAGPAATSVVAHPGDDLNALANSFGAVHLAAGTYNLSSPLVLNKPVSISADPGATLLFSQSVSDTPWTAAVLIHASHTTLDGFAVRFAGPINWDWSVQYNPAVIGTSDNIHSGFGDPKLDITISHMDLQAPPTTGTFDPTPSLLRLVSAGSGRVANNTLKGGTTEVIGGPWQIVDNNYIGTVPGTYTPAAFATHNTHDLVLTGNRVQPTGLSGRTDRFLVMTGGGQGDTIANNTVIGVGPRDGDGLPDTNASEILLTEKYDVHYEGSPSAISAGGLILQIPGVQGSPARAGDVVAILSGPVAGTYRRIAQAIDDKTYLMADPLPAGSYAISIASGFVGETYQGNTIDTRGSSATVNLDLLGNHFGTRVIGNTFLGGGGIQIGAPATEAPNGFGWTHAPMFGIQIVGNTLEDTSGGATITVIDGSNVKSSAGRTYFSGSLDATTIRWTDAFLAMHPSPKALAIGDPAAQDPTSLVLEMSGNVIQTAAEHAIGTPVIVNEAMINGVSTSGVAIGLPRLLPAAPTGLGLVNDSGASATDGLSNDGRFHVTPASGVAGFEAKVGASGVYQAVANPSAFLPAGLVEGSNTVLVRSIDPFRNRGPEVSTTFTLDTTPPITSPPVLAPGSGGVSGIVRIASPSFTVSGDPTDVIVLYRDGKEVARRTGSGGLTEPSALPDGTYSYSLIRTDAAGNPSASPALAVTIDRTPPPGDGPTLVNDSGLSTTDGITNAVPPLFSATGAPGDAIVLLRNGAEVGRRSGPGTIADSGALADGTYAYTLQRTDLAGNSSTSIPLTVTIDRTPPAATAPVLAAESDSGQSSSDGLTNVASPTILVAGDPTDLIVLLRNGVEVGRRTGPGPISDPGPLPDGAALYSARRTDVAGNVSDSPAKTVTIDRTPPPAVSGTKSLTHGAIQFVRTGPGDQFAYRVGTSGAYTPLGRDNTFVPSGLVDGLNVVQIHAVDAAGNAGPDSTVLANTQPLTPSGAWLGQDGSDLVGTSSVVRPNGIQDIHIALAGLRAGKTITSIDVRGLGGGQWLYHGGNGPWAAALVRVLSSTTGDLYIEPAQVETGRPFSIDIRYQNGQHDVFWIGGGAADPKRTIIGSPQPAGTIQAAGVTTGRHVPKGPRRVGVRAKRST